MNEFKELFESDLKRYAGGETSYIKHFHYYLRKCQTTNNSILQHYYHLRLLMVGSKNGIELDYPVQIGKGLYIGHPYCITVNDKVKIGSNCNIHKGVTIGQTNRGIMKGVPVIGNDVWIGINATIVGNITIGNNVLIAPNSYVNFNVPDNSVVIGNPGIIKHKDNATDGYIKNKV